MISAVWLLTRAAAVLVLVHDLYHPQHLWLLNSVVGDVSMDYRGAAARMLRGSLPYVNFRYEYPPASLGVLAAVGGVFGTLRHHFTVGWIGAMVTLDACVAVVLARWPGSVRRGAVWAWVVLLPLLGAFVYVRNDLLVVAPVVVAVWLAARSRPVLAGVSWAVAVLAKIWPVIPLLLYLSSTRDARRRTLVGFAAAVSGVALILAGLGMVGATIRDLSATQGHRPLEVESSWAIALVLIALAQGHQLKQDHRYGSFNLASGVPHGLAPIAYHVTQAVFLAGCLTALWLARRRTSTSVVTVAWACLAFVALTIAVAPVLSPQYVLWLVGFVCILLAVGDRSRSSTLALMLTAVIAVASQLEYPFLFGQVLHEQAAATVIVATRDLLLLVVAAVAVAQVSRSVRSTHGGMSRQVIRVGDAAVDDACSPDRATAPAAAPGDAARTADPAGSRGRALPDHAPGPPRLLWRVAPGRP